MSREKSKTHIKDLKYCWSVDPECVKTVNIPFRSTEANRSRAADASQDVPDPQRSAGTTQVRADKAGPEDATRAHRPKELLPLGPDDEEVEIAATSKAAPRKRGRLPKAKIGVLATTRPDLPMKKGPGRPRKGSRGHPKKTSDKGGPAVQGDEEAPRRSARVRAQTHV